MNKTIHSKPKFDIQPDLTEELYHSLPVSLVALFIVISFIVFELYFISNITYLFYWYTIFCVIILIRIGLLIWYKRTKLQSHLHKKHYYFFVIGSSLSALLLGLLGSVLMPPSMRDQGFILILISGLLAGAAQSLAASLVANLFYGYLTLIPILIWEFIQILEKKYVYIGVFCTMFLFCLFSYTVARAAYLLLVKHLELEYNYKTLSQRVSVMKDKYKEQANHDLLTGLYNRHFLNTYLQLEINKARRMKQNLSIIMLDIDFFKNFNDSYGHEAGDKILQSLGNLLTQSIRKYDIACRYGGEEFLVVLPNTSLEQAERIAESLRQSVKGISVQKGLHVIEGVTLSLGISSYPKDGETQGAIVDAADRAMYKAKREGRDRVCTT